MINKIIYILAQTAKPTDLFSAPPVANPDSAIIKLKNYATLVASDPDKFFNDFMSRMVDFGLKVLGALIIYIIGSIIIRVIKKYLQSAFKRRKTEPMVASFTISIITICATILLIAITVSTLGINTTSIAAILAAGGMAIGMAMSGMLQNFAGGIMIMGFKPFKAGDYIQTGTYEGFVQSVNMVSTKIRTYSNALIILPNGSLFNSNITNITHSSVRRVKWDIQVAYGTNVEDARKIMLDIVKSDSRVLFPSKSLPEIVANPAVSLSELKDSSIVLYCRCWVKCDDYWDVLFDINERIYNELPKNGIKFPFPQMDVHIKQ